MNGKQFSAAMKHGFRSGLEVRTKDYLVERSIKFKYEEIKIEWEDLMYRTYTPDFVLGNGSQGTAPQAGHTIRIHQQ